MSAQDIDDRAGLSVTLVRRLLRTPPHGPNAPDIARTTADAILGIPLPARHKPSVPGLTDSTEASGLLADLARAGWPATTLAQRLGVNPRTIAEVRDKRSRLHLDLALRIRRLRRHLISLDPVHHGIHSADAARTRAAAPQRTTRMLNNSPRPTSLLGDSAAQAAVGNCIKLPPAGMDLGSG
ncbi:hypothetical protein SAMN05216532_8317 [Streptomyces sp. 2231.1]|uniref:hypothetical protein n=1 Tax=Streptomyces sp. 2231.1 TaxID=1855347 RepID=UPI00089926D5|nr:hypothetical protein [Streptomyces sp. 2231.1]SEE67445.1 hypothetical protein SAMN05216532_8317 [Streptomyces sp. 2231.1]